jgi:hypothetical protein
MIFFGITFTPTYSPVSNIFSYFSDMFSASIEDVEKALQVDRVKRNVPVDSPNWDMSEQLVALQARKKAMASYTEDLLLGAQEAHSAL